MITIGLTGGIGSGKSTVLNIWEEQGAYVLRADDLAKNLMQQDSQLKESIRETFGDESYDSEGNLNRGYLSREAFNKGRVNELNALVHPRVRSETQKKINRAKSEGYQAFVYEAALLLQKGRPDYLDYIVLIKAPRERRIKWVSRRDSSDEEEVKRRMVQQQNDEEMEQWADRVLTNDGSLQELKNKAVSLFKQLVES